MKKLIPVVLILSFIFLGGCGAADPNIQAAEAFLTRILTVPDGTIDELARSDLHLENMPEYERQVHEAMLALCGDAVAPEKMLDSSSHLYQEIYMLHVRADYEGYTYTVTEVTVEQIDDRNYSYTAVLDTSDPDKPATAIGSLQFDENNQIDYITIGIRAD